MNNQLKIGKIYRRTTSCHLLMFNICIKQDEFIFIINAQEDRLYTILTDKGIILEDIRLFEKNWEEADE